MSDLTKEHFDTRMDGLSKLVREGNAEIVEEIQEGPDPLLSKDGGPMTYKQATAWKDEHPKWRVIAVEPEPGKPGQLRIVFRSSQYTFGMGLGPLFYRPMQL